MTAPPAMGDDWDLLAEPSGGAPPSPPAAAARPGRAILLAAALGDLVTLLTMCTATMLALRIVGHRPALTTVPWAALLALLWWGAAATTTVTVRRGTPGMLLAGLGFVRQVRPQRVVAVLAAALTLAGCLGLLAVLGAALPLLRSAGAADVALTDPL